MARLTLVPAYGRDYKSQKEVREAWNTGKDFLINDMSSTYNGKYVNKDDLVEWTGTLNIRYKRLTQVCVIMVK